MPPTMVNERYIFQASDLPTDLRVTRSAIEYRLNTGVDPNIALVNAGRCPLEFTLQVDGFAVRVIPDPDISDSIVKIGVQFASV